MKNLSLYVLLAVLISYSGCIGKNNLGAVTLTKEIKALLDFDLNPQEIEAACDKEQSQVKAALDKIAKVPAGEATFENTVKALELALASFSIRIEPVTFLKYVSTDAKVRASADKCETAVSKLYVDIFAREDLFNVLKASNRDTKVGAVDKKLREEYLRNFRNNGLELSPDKRKLFLKKKKELVELTTEFSTNVNEWKDHLEVSKQELDGMPEDYISGLEKTDAGKYKITMAYPHYFPFMQDGKNEAIRRKLQMKFLNRGGDRNKDLLEKAVRIRHELALMLGKKTHAEVVLEERMAKKPETVIQFLQKIKGKLHKKGQADIAEMLVLKKKDSPQANSIEFWDWRYYANQIKKEKFQVDQQKIKEYFPLDVVLKGMFEIYETLLHVDFVELEDASKWHKDVLAYGVVDRKTGKTMSYFFMDLFPRDGKYKHAAAFTILQGHNKADGTYQLPVSSIVANFNAPQDGKPSLLLHSQVETLFHELGHIMHQVLTKAEYASFSGTSVKRDFVEAPSQMLENWCWRKESLAKLSGHYKDKTKPLPDDLLNKLLKAKLANVGIRYLRQVFFATLDMTYHTSASVDSTKIYQDLSKEIMLVPIPDGTMPQASFGHLMGGYDAGYYGYLWSEVYAQDMFTRFDKEGLLSQKPGLDYRKYILEPGGTEEPFALITSFIGREPNEEAFLKSLGLQ